MYLAHSENYHGKVHSLKSHLLGVCARILPFALVPDQHNSLKLAALLHDLGKYLQAFQNYLQNGGVRGSVPHARWGAILAKLLQAEEVSFAIDGHHAGLPDQTTWNLEHTFIDESGRAQLLDLFTAFKADTGIDDGLLTGLRGKACATRREKDLVTRFIFSCLADADWLDTEEHFSPEKTERRARTVLDPDAAIALVNAELGNLAAHRTPINLLREQARIHALEKAHDPVGFFSLNLPTGLGKTLTSFLWALEHAKANGLERIIIVLPYTNIIDQTAERLKDILGQEAVLEHHASYIPVAGNTESEERRKLACENWDAPIILTTSVQFFETLFGNHPGKCRKFHNIAKSVVILDEVQTLPKKIVLPTLDMLQDVRAGLGTSFLFCTATMPAFQKQSTFPGISDITELAYDVESLFEKTRRVRYHLLDNLRAVDMTKLEAALREQKSSTLVIFNTKRRALDLYNQAAASQEWDAVYHLSTAMCPYHRKQVLGEISTAVKDGSQKILVCSTQLVEAGVDLDFPRVFRQMAPLESVIQAAGRCNREGCLPEPGNVVLFNLKGGGYPDAFYKTQAEYVRALLADNPDTLYDYASFNKYYSKIMRCYVVNEPITALREQCDFATVAANYRIIDNKTQSLFIWEYNTDSRKLYATLRAKEHRKLPLSREEYRAMQQYSVQVYDNDLFKGMGSWERTRDDILVWNGEYNKDTGLCIIPRNVDALIV